MVSVDWSCQEVFLEVELGSAEWEGFGQTERRCSGPGGTEAKCGWQDGQWRESRLGSEARLWKATEDLMGEDMGSPSGS